MSKILHTTLRTRLLWHLRSWTYQCYQLLDRKYIARLHKELKDQQDAERQKEATADRSRSNRS